MDLRWVMLLPLLLAGCGFSDSASYMVGGNRDQALTLLREKAWAWSGEVELAVVVSRQPDCMRRHTLKPAPSGESLKVELFRSMEGAYIIRQGNNYYVTEMRKCRLQAFKEPPLELGDGVGVFKEKDGRLAFAAP